MLLTYECNSRAGSPYVRDGLNSTGVILLCMNEIASYFREAARVCELLSGSYGKIPSHGNAQYDALVRHGPGFSQRYFLDGTETRFS